MDRYMTNINHSSSMQSGRSKGSCNGRKCTAIPLGALKEGHTMDPLERTFLEAVERGDKHTVIRCLQDPKPVNVNCTSILGRSALQTAADNENLEITEILLQQPDIEIGDALMYAIQEGVYALVEMLINHTSITTEMLGSQWSSIRKPGEESNEYSLDISPVILAATCNQFEILQLLLSRGARIDNPHKLSCSCTKCTALMNEDSLRHSLRRIHTYRALASPAWMSLTSADPILTAFGHSCDLHQLAMVEIEFQDVYMDLSNQCKRYACSLLDQCRSSDEVIAVLNKENDDSDESVERNESVAEENNLTLSRLKLAIKYEQKQFVAHPHCQQLLSSIWYDGIPGWRRHNRFVKVLTAIGLISAMPLMAVYYLILPKTKVGKILRSPFMKFMYHSVSFFVFLCLLLCSSTEISYYPGRERRRGPKPLALELCIVIYVCGFIWSECKQLWEEGGKAYVRQWWNWLDFMMLSLYLCTFSLRIVAYVQINSGKYGPSELDRKFWPKNDPTLISEGLFAVANIFSFARIIYLFQANSQLGPLQISLGCMLIDIAKFLVIFFLILSSFACGLNQLYWQHRKTSGHEANTGGFTSLDLSYGTLIWALFGVTQLKSLELADGQEFTNKLGELVFMVYHGMAIIVLINMLIAMMSSSFQEIEEHGDMEWKFTRSKLWMGYFDEGSTLPVPFNIIISPKSVYYAIRWIKRYIVNCFKSERKQQIKKKKAIFTSILKAASLQKSACTDVDISNGGSCTVNPPDSVSRAHYQVVMRKLVSRYIQKTKKELRDEGVNEDDLLEIKQDISSLRYELREDRKRELASTGVLLEDLKSEISNLVCGSKGHIRTAGSLKNYKPSAFRPVGNVNSVDVELLKNEIVDSLRQDICEIVKSVSCRATVVNSEQPQQDLVLPPASSELYHTHLYTQL